jgi:L-rhamnose isomerase
MNCNFCLRQNVSAGSTWKDTVKKYDRYVFSLRK